MSSLMALCIFTYLPEQIGVSDAAIPKKPGSE
jgi:hypothetical protein